MKHVKTFNNLNEDISSYLLTGEEKIVNKEKYKFTSDYKVTIEGLMKYMEGCDNERESQGY